MGSTYANLVVVGATQEDVVDALAGADALVSPADGGAVVVFARGDEEALGSGLTARRLSSGLGRPALDAMVFDSDVCTLQVVADGRVVGSAVAPPGAMEAFDEEGPDPDPGAFADIAVNTLGRGDPAAVAAALHTGRVFAEESHRDVLSALGLPAWAAGWGFRYLAADAPELPCGALLRTP